jgi:hypothetical protein
MDQEQPIHDVVDAISSLTPSLVAALREHQGSRLASVPNPAANLQYHLFADAIYWSDELETLPSELDDAFRVVLNHRTSLLLGDIGRFKEVWEAAKVCFPKWVGFRPERCTANAEIADRITRIRHVSGQQLDRWLADPNNREFPSE